MIEEKIDTENLNFILNDCDTSHEKEIIKEGIKVLLFEPQKVNESLIHFLNDYGLLKNKNIEKHTEKDYEEEYEDYGGKEEEDEEENNYENQLNLTHFVNNHSNCAFSNTKNKHYEELDYEMYYTLKKLGKKEKKEIALNNLTTKLNKFRKLNDSNCILVKENTKVEDLVRKLGPFQPINKGNKYQNSNIKKIGEINNQIGNKITFEVFSLKYSNHLSIIGMANFIIDDNEIVIGRKNHKDNNLENENFVKVINLPGSNRENNENNFSLQIDIEDYNKTYYYPEVMFSINDTKYPLIHRIDGISSILSNETEWGEGDCIIIQRGYLENIIKKLKDFRLNEIEEPYKFVNIGNLLNKYDVFVDEYGELVKTERNIIVGCRDVSNNLKAVGRIFVNTNY